jgi:rhomboid protease GluP
MTDTQRKSILCPSCRKLINADEPECPYCGTSNPGSWLKSNFWTRGFHSPEQPVYVLIALNVVIYVLTLMFYRGFGGGGHSLFSFLGPTGMSLDYFGATGLIPLAQGRFWTLISANFLHAGILHILFNMLALRNIGPLIVHEYGAYRFLIIYILTGVIGFFVSSIVGVRFTIGASAAVCGLIGAALYFGKSRGGTYGNEIFQQVIGWVVALAIFGFVVPGINNWGHGGGLVAGIALAFVLGYNDRSRETMVHKGIAGACALITAGVLLFAVFSGIAGYR